MFNSVVISIAITLVFIFLLLAIMVTAINELMFTFMRSKSKQLEGFLDKLYFDDEDWKDIFKKLKNSPFINVLKKGPHKFPGAIPAETFTTALLAQIGKNELTIEAIQRVSDEHKDSQSDFYVMLRAILSQKPTFEQLRAEIDKMFNNAMDRLTGWYRRNAKIRSFVVAAIICFTLNVDTITITKNLWNNKDKADQLASSAVASVNYFEKVDSTKVVLKSGIDREAQGMADNKALTTSKVGQAVASLDTTDNKPAQQLQESYGVLSSMDLPIGWTKDNMPAATEKPGTKALLWFLKLLGILLTTAAVSMGSPYWFDLLNKLTPLKQSTSKPAAATSSPQNNPAVANNDAGPAV